MKFPNSSYNLTMLDFSSMKGFSPREVFKKIFSSTGKYSLLDYSLREIENKYDTISVNETYLNRHLFEFDDWDGGRDIKRNLIYAPFFLSEWQGAALFGCVVFNPRGDIYSALLGNLTTDSWVSRPHLPKPTLEQNKGESRGSLRGVLGGWFSNRLILFPTLNHPTLNHPEGI